MIVRSTLLMPSEQPATLLDLKVALLTYDTVALVDPNDRDLFPGTGMAMAMGMPPVVSLPSTTPIRRIGKAPGYDDEFDAVLEGAKAAISQGSVSVVSTYRPPAPDLMIGSVDLGGFPLNLPLLLTLYRTAAADPQFQAAAVEGDPWLFAAPDRVWQVAEGRGDADVSINNTPPLPDVTFHLANEALRKPLSNIARARIAHTIKLTGFCMTKGLVPHGSHQWHDSILRTILRKSAEFVDQISEADPYWNYRNRALRLIHEEYLDVGRLDQMSIEDVLRLRTAAWGAQAKAREALFDSVGQLSRETIEEADFNKAVSEKIRDYRQKAAEVEDERASLLFKVTCEVSKGALGAAAALTASGAIATLGTGLGATAALVGATCFALQKYQDLKPIAEQLRQAEHEFGSDARFGIHNFYERLT
ncbi:hypothetical protein [Bradyrhizobium cosmicum]|uniref:Uncharacterized protein n=1 Tax=Bradyrhizobium cosmicum TaxID=1404864 RepID=A0AAI8QBV7_9BRAD|nr:hypothetical protein [Bradyrhizobium cosmicum]BAL75998.1 hypothetical protein S23_27860 [Bradyrhizobium cosmicum]